MVLGWPVAGTVTAGFGWKAGKPHTGIDISASLGAVVRAAASGKVIFAGQMQRYGNVVILDHQNGFFSVYGHVRKALVTKGSRSAPTTVARGQAIAEVGATGEAVGPQLHFEVRKLNQAVDPMRYLGSHGPGGSASVPRRR
jgi:murein DD-endopeptidase MepM/ murein hydrolase activator NlpD